MIVTNPKNAGTVVYPRKDVTSVNIRKGYSTNDPVLFFAASPTKLGTLTGRMWSIAGKWSWHEIQTASGLGWGNGEFLTVTAPVPVALPRDQEAEPEMLETEEVEQKEPKKQGNVFLVAALMAATLLIID